MKNSFVFVLILFLFFSTHLVSAATKCRYYLDGVCQTSDKYSYNEVVVPIEEAIQTQTSQELWNYDAIKYLAMTFQIIGLVALLVLIIIIVQKLTNHKILTKSKRRR